MADLREVMADFPEAKKKKMKVDDLGAISTSAKSLVAGDAPEVDDCHRTEQEEEDVYVAGSQENSSSQEKSGSRGKSSSQVESTLATDHYNSNSGSGGSQEEEEKKEVGDGEGEEEEEEELVPFRETLVEAARRKMYDDCVKQFRKTRGFDVDVSGLPKTIRNCFPKDINKPEFQPHLGAMCKLALGDKVASKDPHLEFVRVLKASSLQNHLKRCSIYYLTFEVIDKLDGTLKTYQAVVRLTTPVDVHAHSTMQVQVPVLRPEPPADAR